MDKQCVVRKRHHFRDTLWKVRLKCKNIASGIIHNVFGDEKNKNETENEIEEKKLRGNRKKRKTVNKRGKREWLMPFWVWEVSWLWRKKRLEKNKRSKECLTPNRWIASLETQTQKNTYGGIYLRERNTYRLHNRIHFTEIVPNLQKEKKEMKKSKDKKKSSKEV